MNDTIAAIATAPGRGGIGVIRVSGPQTQDICQKLIGQTPPVRQAHFTGFLRADGAKIDQGLVLFFKHPNSFTGEDVLELHGHGGPVIMDMLLRRVLELGARMARAGEFSERAFLNNKIDLLQAEAVAELISASSEQAALAAVRSLQGEFSSCISELVEELIRLRLYVEAALDFPDEDLDLLQDQHLQSGLQQILKQLENIYLQAKQGALLSEGIDLVIAGRPNAGKSTLLNKFTGQDTAIVTPIAGTTRDVVKAQLNLDGLLINILDTAGLRDTDDLVEKAGIAKTWRAIELADLVLLVVDGIWEPDAELLAKLKPGAKVLGVCNKIDLQKQAARVEVGNEYTVVHISANTGSGLDLLRSEIKKIIGLSVAENTGVFSARRRHLDALNRAQQHILFGEEKLQQTKAAEILAEELRQAQQALCEITGAFTSDDLLGRIFSEFCIGK